MTPRLTSSMLVSALIRRVAAEGGNAAIITKGDPVAGAIMLMCLEKGKLQSISERVLGHDGSYAWTPNGPTQPDEIEAFLKRRQNRDPDLWIVELDIPNAERFAAETTGEG